MLIADLFRKAASLLDKLFPLRTDDALAEPWRRLLAATLDSILLMAVGAVGYVAIVTSAPPQDTIDHVFQIGGPILCWGYVVVGWATGATPGMRMCGIRLVTEQLTRLSIGTVLNRLVGFWLACLPVKIGLLPILFDQRRQGWHDRLAHTLIVKTSRCSDAIPARISQQELPNAVVPDFGVPRKLWFLPLAAYTALCLAMTWPVAAHISTRLAGIGGDSYIFLWNYWYFGYAITHHLSPLYTNLIYFPRTVSLGMHTMQWFNCILAYALHRFLNPTATYNVLTLISLTLSAFAGYWMTAAIVRSRRAGFVAGIATGFSAYLTSHELGHANLVAIEFIPLFLVYAYAAFVTLRYRYAIWAGVWMALAGLCDLQYAAFSALVGIVLIAGLTLYSKREGWLQFRRRVLLFGGAGVVCGILLLPIVLAALGDMAGGNQDKSGVGGAFRMDAIAWLKPGMGSYFWGADRFGAKDIESNGSPGIIMIALVVVGMVRRWRDARLWAFVTLCFGILACGPFLTIRGRGLNTVMSIIIGFPGTDFNLPWDFGGYYIRSQYLITSPTQFLQSDYYLQMPFVWLPKVIPLLKPFRVPARFAVVVLMGVAVMSGYGFIEVVSWVQQRNKAAARFVIGVVAAGLIAEYWVAPFKTVETQTFPAYAALGRIPGVGAMIEIPLQGHEITAYGQTFHHKPLFKSFISRNPKGGLSLVENNQFLKDATDAWTPLPDTKVERVAFNECYALGARYVGLNLPSGESKAWVNRLEGRYCLRLIYADATGRIYAIDGPIKQNPQ